MPNDRPNYPSSASASPKPSDVQGDPPSPEIGEMQRSKKMTLDEFFTALEKTPRDWKIEPRWGHLIIRRDSKSDKQCPLTAVAGLGNPILWRDAARDMGLKRADALKILNAADRRGTLRKRLLAACDLKEW